MINTHEEAERILMLVKQLEENSATGVLICRINCLRNSENNHDLL